MKEKENLTIPSYNSLHTGTLQLLQIALMILKSVSKETSFFPPMVQ